MAARSRLDTRKGTAYPADVWFLWDDESVLNWSNGALCAGICLQLLTRCISQGRNMARQVKVLTAKSDCLGSTQWKRADFLQLFPDLHTHKHTVTHTHPNILRSLYFKTFEVCNQYTYICMHMLSCDIRVFPAKSILYPTWRGDRNKCSALLSGGDALIHSPQHWALIGFMLLTLTSTSLFSHVRYFIKYPKVT